MSICRWSCLLVVAGLSWSQCAFGAVDDAPEESPAAANAAPSSEAQATVEDVYQRTRPSLAVITVAGRDGRQRSLGSGFVISADGLIATNMHVIGEGRPIAVQLADGKRYDVTSIHASDWNLDLAVIKIDAQGLRPLELGDSDALRQGQSVAALGNPLGLAHSVVSGVVSGRREIDGRSMIQLAIPLERGNSGGPLVDLAGQVRGVLTMKSAVTANLGFAAAINDLKPLLARPNPVPIDRWVKRSLLDPAAWQPLWGAEWRAHGAKIVVEGAGDRFGGRSLCLAAAKPETLPYVIEVSVRLDDESGAAGLAFAADGGDRHYGFYPSGGGLRLTRFDGPDVSSWTILAQQASPHYHQGRWNRLQARVENDRIDCYVNGHRIFTAKVPSALAGKVGLAKFRDTRAEFKGFRVENAPQDMEAAREVEAKIEGLVAGLPTGSVAGTEVLGRLAAEKEISPAALDQHADRLADRARQLRLLAENLRQSQVRGEILKLLDHPEEEIDLASALLWVSRLDNADVEPDVYRRQLDRLATELIAAAGPDADEATRFAALHKYFFEASGFHGSRGDYYHRSNSYLDEVLDDREGLPITLSVVYMELARRLKLHVEGVGLPGHFVVRYRPHGGEGRLIDVYDAGKDVAHDEAVRRVTQATGGEPPTAEHFAAATKRAIVIRVLHNLLGLAQREEDARGMLCYLETIVALAPQDRADRFRRALARWQTGDRAGAKEDADWLLEHDDGGATSSSVRQLRAALERGED